MTAITIGTGYYAEMARHAARRLTEMTGLHSVVITDTDFAASGLRHPLHLKFHLFDFVDDADVLYFDADLVCLTAWDPKQFLGSDGIVAVRDRMMSDVRRDAQRMGLAPEDYFNAGFLIVNRERHRSYFEVAERIIDLYGDPFSDQAALNAARAMLRIPLRLLDRRYNWVGFDDGGVCCNLAVFMAHGLRANGKDTTLI